MIDRNKVAAEKMARAAELMEQYGIDMWAIYSRMKTDTALELMFNTDTKNEVLFILTGAERIAVCCPEDEARFAQSGLYTKVLPVQPDGYMEVFRDCFFRCGVKRLALNCSTEDTRCDGLTVGLYRKLEKAVGREAMKQAMVSSYKMLEELRAVKTPSEIEIMKECSVITTDIYDALFRRIHVGLTEVGVAKMMMEECAKRAIVHPSPSSRGAAEGGQGVDEAAFLDIGAMGMPAGHWTMETRALCFQQLKKTVVNVCRCAKEKKSSSNWRYSTATSRKRHC